MMKLDSFRALLWAPMAMAALVAGLVLVVLLGVVADPARAAFPGKNGKIAFQSNGEIYVVNPDGSGLANLTNSPEQGEWSLAWSPDGTRIAFTSFNYQDFNGDIYVMNADGSGTPSNITNNDYCFDAYFPDWSPDGTEIAFENGCWKADEKDVYVANPDGTEVRNLTSEMEFEQESPNFSPDGAKIAFFSPIPAEDNTLASVLYVMNADGSGKTLLTDPTTGEPIYGQYYLDWQPLPAAYDFSGFFSPVDNFPTLNQAKAGSVIPVKFSLNGDQGLEIFAQDYPKSKAIACEATDPVDAIEQTLSANSSGLTYDATTDQYIYVWKTNQDWRGCRQLVVKLNDGTEHRANFKFTG